MRLQDAGKQEPEDDIQCNKEKEEPAQPEVYCPDLHFVRFGPVPVYTEGKSGDCKKYD
jgi:hypothetical protein